jgi:hypothetical protein
VYGGLVIALPTTGRAKPGCTSSGASSTAVDDLVAVLRATPCYEWPRLRQQGEGEWGPAFEKAAALVRVEWSPEERLVQMQRALAEVLAHAALARVTVETTAAGDVDAPYVEHVRRAGDALQAAQELIRLGSAA